MRILFDKNVPYPLRQYLEKHEVRTAAEQGWDRRLGGALGATALGTAVIYAFGVPWFAITTGRDAFMAVADGLAPFLPVDILKLVAAALFFPAAWWVVGRRPSEA